MKPSLWCVLCSIVLLGAGAATKGFRQKSGQQGSGFPGARAWTVNENVGAPPIFDNGRIYFYARSDAEGGKRYHESVQSVDATSGKILWSQEVSWPRESRETPLLTFDGEYIFLSQSSFFDQSPQLCTVLVLDADSGSLSKSFELDGAVIAALKDRLLVSKGDSVTLTTYPDLRKIWSASTIAKNNTTCSLSSNVLLVRSQGVVALDYATGEQIWASNVRAASVSDGLVVTASYGYPIELREIASGKLLWKNESEQWEQCWLAAGAMWAIAWDMDLTGRDEHFLVGLDPHDGKELWRKRINQPNGIGVGQIFYSGDLLIANALQPQAFTTNGDFLWQWPAMDETFDLQGVEGGTIVVTTRNKLMGYRLGVSRNVVSDEDKVDVAKELAQKFDQLDSMERNRLAALGPAAFEPMLPVLEKLRKSAPYYDRNPNVYDALRIVAKSLNRDNVPKFIAVLEGWGLPSYESEGAPIYTALELSRCADPNLMAPYYKSIVFGSDWQNPKELVIPPQEIYTVGAALKGWMTSSDPGAVSYGMNLVADPKIYSGFKEIVYTSLAASENPTALEFLLKVRNGRKPLPSVLNRTRLNTAESSNRYELTYPPQIQRSHVSASEEWSLLKSACLGNYHDLWIAKKVDGTWLAPMFTGLTHVEDGYQWVAGTPPTRFRSLQDKDLAGDKWFSLFVGAEEIKRDSDGDGLTDVSEMRLSTNRAKADSDDDGMRDSEDPCPNAPSRDLTEDEEVIQAAFEARYHYNGYLFPLVNADNAPAVIEIPADMKIMEFYGWPGPLIVSNGREQNGPYADVPLAKHYLQGTIRIGFAHIDSSPQGSSGYTIAHANEIVTWGKDRRTASVPISTSYDMHHFDTVRVDMKKIGESWFAVNMELLASYP